MNERIKELALKAGGGLSCIAEPLEHPWKFSERELEKFAELIVKECAEVCYNHSVAAGGVDTAFGYGYKDCGNDIKRHFGVEE
jgi:hypothetical protein